MRWIAVLVLSLAGVAMGAAGLLLLGDDDPEDLLPDLEQRIPRDLEIVEEGDSYRLVFATAVANVGQGPLLVEAERPNRETPTMNALQLVRRTDGTARLHPLPSPLRYAESEGSGRWQLPGFVAVELRRLADGEIAKAGETAGVCLRDGSRSNQATQAAGGPERPIWVEECGREQPGALVVREGISPGYGIAFDSARSGPFVDVTSVPAGRYVLVQRVNPVRALEESNYGNNAASALIQLRREGELPSVRVLARCPGTDECSAGQR
jgi:hypothetical protein